MTIFNKYIEYMKDNPEGLWFKRKLFGWGWTPVKWQGWVVILVYVLCLVALSFFINKDSSITDSLFTFILPIVLLTAVLIVICYKKGEKPRWQWGLSDKE